MSSVLVRLLAAARQVFGMVMEDRPDVLDAVAGSEYVDDRTRLLE